MKITSLSTEVLSVIAGFLITPIDRDQRAVRQDLHHLTLTCRRLKDVATPLLYRSISVPNGSSATHLFHTLMHNPHIRPLIRGLHINRGTRRTRLNRPVSKDILPPEPTAGTDSEGFVKSDDVSDANGFFEANFERACRSTFKNLKWDIDSYSSADVKIFSLGECNALASGSLPWEELQETGLIQLTSSILVGILCLAPKLNDVQLPVLIDQPCEILGAMIGKARATGCLSTKIVPHVSSFGAVSEWLSLI